MAAPRFLSYDIGSCEGIYTQYDRILSVDLEESKT